MRVNGIWQKGMCQFVQGVWNLYCKDSGCYEQILTLLTSFTTAPCSRIENLEAKTAAILYIYYSVYTYIQVLR